MRGMFTRIMEIHYDVDISQLTCTLKYGNVADSINDPRASCSNNTYRAIVSTCVRAGCNITEEEGKQQAKGSAIGLTIVAAATFAGKVCEGIPKQSRAKLVIIVGIIFGTLAVLAVILRCYSRLKLTEGGGLASDDWTIVVAAVVMVGLIAGMLLRK